jgi:hypothetical protein
LNFRDQKFSWQHKSPILNRLQYSFVKGGTKNSDCTIANDVYIVIDWLKNIFISKFVVLVVVQKNQANWRGFSENKRRFL